MIGGGADDRQAERDVDAFLEMERLQRDQRLVVIHAQCRVILRAGGGVEHRIGREGTGHEPSLGAQRGDRRLDDFDLLAPDHPAFTGVRIERRHREARPLDPEILLQATQRRPPARLDQRAGQHPRYLAQRHVDRHRHRPQRRSGEHHRDIRCRHAATLGDEFGLAGMGKADRVELLLADRRGYDCARGARSRQAHRQFERIERGVRPGERRLARLPRLGRGDRQHRQAMIERRIGLARVVDDNQFAVPHGRDRARITDRDERRQAERVTVIPAFRDNFGTDPCRIAKRYRERQWAVACQETYLKSMIASRRRSRR